MIISSDVSAALSGRSQVLGRFEESILLVAMICGPDATADMIKSKLDESIGSRALTSVVTTLDRLQDKGMLESMLEDSPSNRKGGRKRRLFKVTPSGMASAERSVSAMHRLAEQAGFGKVA